MVCVSNPSERIKDLFFVMTRSTVSGAGFLGSTSSLRISWNSAQWSLNDFDYLRYMTTDYRKFPELRPSVLTLDGIHRNQKHSVKVILAR